MWGGLKPALTPGQARVPVLHCSFCRRADRRAVAAVGIVAVLDVALALRLLLQEIRRLALRAGAGDGAAVQGELALRVARARIENAAAGAALHQLSLAALRALHAGRLRRRRLPSPDLADVAAVGIAGAGEEWAVAAALQNHLLAAQLARWLRLGREVRLHQARVLRVLALGVAGAGEELPEARALELHRLPALLADDLLVVRGGLGGVALG